MYFVVCLCKKCIFQIISRHLTSDVFRTYIKCTLCIRNLVNIQMQWSACWCTHTNTHMRTCILTSTTPALVYPNIAAAAIALCVYFFFVVREKFGTLSVIKCWTCFCEFIINENKYNNYAYVCVWIINTLKHTYVHAYKCTKNHRLLLLFILWFRYDDDGDWHSEIETGIIGIEMYIILFIRTISLFQVLPKVLVSALRYICMRLCLYVCM